MTMRVENNLADRLAAIPGVDSVGFARNVPMDGIEPAWNNIFIQGKNERAGSAPMRLFNYIAPGYFLRQGTRLVAGRDYSWDDIYGLRPVGIVSENLARESWGSAQAAIGKHFRIMPTQSWVEVVGVAQDVHQNGVDEEARATVYWPVMLKLPWANNSIDTEREVTFVAHSSRAGTESLRSEIQQAVGRTLRTLLFGVSPLDPLSFAAVPFILAAASALASFLPASRVASINFFATS
jgi:hypothetical protein